MEEWTNNEFNSAILDRKSWTPERQNCDCLCGVYGGLVCVCVCILKSDPHGLTTEPHLTSCVTSVRVNTLATEHHFYLHPSPAKHTDIAHASEHYGSFLQPLSSSKKPSWQPSYPKMDLQNHPGSHQHPRAATAPLYSPICHSRDDWKKNVTLFVAGLKRGEPRKWGRGIVTPRHG